MHSCIRAHAAKQYSRRDGEGWHTLVFSSLAVRYQREAPSLVCSPVSCHVCKLSLAAVACACFEHPNALPRTIIPEEINALSLSETHPESWQALSPPIQCHALSITVPPDLLLHPFPPSRPWRRKTFFPHSPFLALPSSPKYGQKINMSRSSSLLAAPDFQHEAGVAAELVLEALHPLVKHIGRHLQNTADVRRSMRVRG